MYALESSERSERNDLLNRMAQLEQRGPAVATAPAYGANPLDRQVVMPIALFL